MSGLSAPRILFGVHSISPYSRADSTPYGILKVVGSAGLAMTSTIEEIYGGAQRFSWAAEAKTIKAEVSCKVKAYPGFLFSLFLGATVVDTGASTTGSISALTNALNASVMNSTTGIASLAITSNKNGDLKFAQYLIKAASSTTVDVYLMSDVDINRGPDPASYQTDLLKITASALTVTASTGTAIPNTGVTLTGGSGTIGMTTGDTAIFSTYPINNSSETVLIGASTTSAQNFGAWILAQKRANGEMFELQAFNCVAFGLPIALDEMAFSHTEFKMSCFWDPVQNAVFSVRSVVPTTFT